MIHNRISNWLEYPTMDEPASAAESDFARPQSFAVPQLSVSLANVYEAARQMAVRDVELDKLFNAEYYEEEL